jgi:hypothetical protein
MSGPLANPSIVTGGLELGIRFDAGWMTTSVNRTESEPSTSGIDSRAVN